MRALILFLCFAVVLAKEEECGENAVFSTCGTACPLTCANYRNPPQVCVAMCAIGCQCVKGYVRSADGQCVRPEQCESHAAEECADNEVYNACGSACPSTCDNYNISPRICFDVCKAGCECKDGYVRNPAGRCVLTSQCEGKSCLDKPDPGMCFASFPKWYYDAKTGKCHEFVYGGCQGNGNRYNSEKECLDHCSGVTSGGSNVDLCALPKLTGPCRAYFPRYFYNQVSGQCEKFVYGGCRGNQNNFKTMDECHNTCAAQQSHHECPENEHFEACGTQCPLTCDNFNDPPQACILSCNIGCHCDEGYVRHSNGQCVKTSDC